MRIKWIVLWSIMILTLGIIAGCGTNENTGNNDQQKNETEVQQAPVKEIAAESTADEEENNEVADTKAQMMIANYIISEQGVHEMDEQIAKGELDESFLRNVQMAKSIAESITWDSSLDEIVSTFNKDINELEQALIANDVEKAKEPAAAVHESQHDLDNAVSKLVHTMTGSDMKAQMMIANYIISEQGVHEMDEQIAKGEIEESFLRNVQKAISIAESITWDPSLDEIISVFNKDINDLEQALIANDVEKAKEPAAAVHESQHDLDNAVSKLVNTMTGPDMKAQMMIANYIISEQGVHEMDEQISKGEIDESFLRNVQKAKSIAESITWDPSLDEIISTFNNDINDLEQALIANDVEKAKEPAAAVHESQHDLDNAVSNLIKEFVQLTNSNQEESKNENQNVDVVDVDEVDGTVLNMYDWDFDNIKLEKGKNVIILKNEGNMPHGVLIPELGVMSDDVGSGETIIWEIDVDETGEFTFYCSIPECGTPEQHSEMIGEVIVE